MCAFSTDVCRKSEKRQRKKKGKEWGGGGWGCVRGGRVKSLRQAQKRDHAGEGKRE